MTKVSVCLASHNGEKYIKEQIDSILSQLSFEDELIISDDGSSDSTIDIITRYDDKRIKLLYYSQPKDISGTLKNFMKASNNFENALRHVAGEYVFLSDQDDIWYPHKVEICIQCLEEGYDLVRTNSMLIDRSGLMKSLLYLKNQTPLGDSLLKNIIRMKFSGSHMAFRSNFLKYALPFPKNIISHDNWIGCMIFYYGKCKFISDPLIKYRIHGENVSCFQKNSIFFKIYYRSIFLVKLLIRIILIFLNKNKYKRF